MGWAGRTHLWLDSGLVVQQESPVTDPNLISRRQLLRRLALGVSVATVALARAPRASAAQLPLLSPGAQDANAVHYVEDASQAKGATAGANCASCGLYAGASGSAQGPCQIFPGKDVKAKGWCSSWAPQM
jgi:hypothetical protein